MDPITLILAALTAGAALGLKDAASSAVSDAYGALKSLVGRKLAGRRDGELALERYEAKPEVWEAPLKDELVTVRAGEDAELVEAARRLMALADDAGSRAGKYDVVIHDSRNFQVGDRNVQYNVEHGGSDAPSDWPAHRSGPQ